MTKTCFKCDMEKDISEFYKHTGMADGHLNKCKECTKQDTRNDYARNPHKHRAYDIARSQRTARKAQNIKNTRTQREKHPDRYKARTAVNNAIRDGRLQRQPCEICGKQAQAHHEDYSKPLDVRWICFRHHRANHGQLLQLTYEETRP